MLSTLLTSIFTGEAALAVKRARVAAIAYGLIAVCVLCALGFLLSAGYIYASELYGPLRASLGFAACFLLLACIIWIVFRIGSRTRAKRRKKRHQGELVSLATAAAIAAVPTFMKGRSVAGLIGLPLVGLVAAQIYRENTRRSAPSDTDDDLDQ